MNAEARKELKEALDKFLESTQKINKLWNENSHECSLVLNRMYPFKLSFDDLEHEIEFWVEDAKLNMERFSDEEDE